jgi:hypothetical protein
MEKALRFFENYTVQCRRSQHACTRTPKNTRTQTNPYEHLRRTEHRQIWRFSKSPLIPHRRREHRLPLNAWRRKIWNKFRKGANSRIWTLMGSAPLDHHTIIGLQAHSSLFVKILLCQGHVTLIEFSRRPSHWIGYLGHWIAAQHKQDQLSSFYLQ